MPKRRVVLTGASGYVAQRMFADLAERWEIVPIDVRDTTSRGDPVPGIVVANLADPNRDAYRRYFRNADAVIHCAFIKPAEDSDWDDNTDAKFLAEHQNLALAYNVYRTALEENVRRVVVASSNHATDYYERQVWADKLDMITTEMPPRSDNWYGWSKASYEQLGYVFATGRVGTGGRKLEVVQWRIGGPRDDEVSGVKPGDLKGLHRALGAFLSRRDQVQQTIRMVETENIADTNGVPFLIVYGISGNTHRFWSLAGARGVLGYRPDDDSQRLFMDRIAAIVREAGG